MSYLDINPLCWSNDMCIRLSFHSLRDSHTLSFMAMNIGRKKSKQISMDSFLLGQHNASYCKGQLVAVIFNYTRVGKIGPVLISNIRGIANFL